MCPSHRQFEIKCFLADALKSPTSAGGPAFTIITKNRTNSITQPKKKKLGVRDPLLKLFVAFFIALVG
jgi:hypothetical protein